MEMPPEVKEQLEALEKIVNELQLKYHEELYRVTKPYVEEIIRIRNWYPAPFVVDLRALTHPQPKAGK